MHLDDPRKCSLASEALVFSALVQAVPSHLKSDYDFIMRHKDAQKSAKLSPAVPQQPGGRNLNLKLMNNFLIAELGDTAAVTAIENFIQPALSKPPEISEKGKDTWECKKPRDLAAAMLTLAKNIPDYFARVADDDHEAQSRLLQEPYYINVTFYRSMIEHLVNHLKMIPWNSLKQRSITFGSTNTVQQALSSSIRSLSIASTEDNALSSEISGSSQPTPTISPTSAASLGFEWEQRGRHSTEPTSPITPDQEAKLLQPEFV